MSVEELWLCKTLATRMFDVIDALAGEGLLDASNVIALHVAPGFPDDAVMVPVKSMAWFAMSFISIFSDAVGSLTFLR
jgi:hypothetical protein